MNVTMRILVGIPSWHARSHTREKTYRIFSISWSSGREDLRNSTW
jgi:hypothetical protein